MRTILKIISFIVGLLVVFLTAAFCKWSLDPELWEIKDRCATAFLGIIVGGMAACYPKIEA